MSFLLGFWAFFWDPRLLLSVPGPLLPGLFWAFLVASSGPLLGFFWPLWNVFWASPLQGSSRPLLSFFWPRRGLFRAFFGPFLGLFCASSGLLVAFQGPLLGFILASSKPLLAGVVWPLRGLFWVSSGLRPFSGLCRASSGPRCAFPELFWASSGPLLGSKQA